MEKYIGYFDNKINIIHKVKSNDKYTITSECGLDFFNNSFYITETTEEQVKKMKESPSKYNVKYCTCAK